MSNPSPTDTFEFGDNTAHNEAALAELASAIAFGQGADTITLLLVRCNYVKLRDHMVTALLEKLQTEDLQGPVHLLPLAVAEHNLYAQIHTVAQEQRPGAVVVVGTETVTALAPLLVEMNKRREDFRRDFPFPLVLWFTDDGYRQLSDHANDFESIAGGETIEFRLSGAALSQQLQAAAQRMYEALLQTDVLTTLHRRLENLDLGDLRSEEVAIALAELEGQNYPLEPDLQASVAFARGLTLPNDEAAAVFEANATHWATPSTDARASLKQGLSLYYLGRARYFAADNVKYQAPAWAAAVPPLEQCLTLFDQAQRPDLVAQCIIQLVRVQHRLGRWEELDVTAQRSLALHQANGDAPKLAQDYGFLADVALHRQQWEQAATLAQQALDACSDSSWWRILYLKMLAQATYALGDVTAATTHLQTAQTMGVMDHPRLHSDILTLLQQCLRDQQQYLAAFQVKRERLAVEKQYGLRAFIGAGRLRSQRLEQRATVQSHRETLEDIAPEIAASGRAQDLTELLRRIAGRDDKLLVLHGASGVGKSSLVNGGLLPALQARALENRLNVPVLMRQYTNWPREVAQRLQVALTTLPQVPAGVWPVDLTVAEDSQSFDQLIASLLTVLQICERATLRPVLIFDQFEEFFFANASPLARRDFFRFIADCLELPGALKIVFSLREDYLHYLLAGKQIVRQQALPAGSMARSQLEDILGKRVLYEIGNFAPEDAQAIIQQLAAGARMYLEPALIAALVADLAGDLQEVRPIEMQIVGAQLQTEGIQTLRAYRELGEQPKETLVQRYLEDVVVDCGAENRQLAELVLFLLTDERGTRPLKTRPELVRDLDALGLAISPAPQPPSPANENAVTATTASPLDLVLKILGGSGIAVQLPDSPDDRYQLVHDYLAGVIRERQAPQLEALVAELEQEKQKRREAEAGLAELTAATATARVEQAELTRQNRQARRFLTGTVAVSTFVVGGVLALATQAGIDANQSRAEALQTRKIAQVQQIKADYNLAMAEFTVGAANLQVGLAQAEVEAAVQREAEAEARVEEAETRRAEIDQQAKADVKAAQAAVNTAQAELTLAEQASAAAQVELIAAETAKAEALVLQELAQEGTTLERLGTNARRQADSDQLGALVTAVEVGSTLQTLVSDYNIADLADYPATSPISTLQLLLNTLQETHRLRGHSVAGVRGEFSADGDQVVTASRNTAQVWDLHTGESTVLAGHTGWVNSAEFSADDQRIVTASDDTTARVWDWHTSKSIVLEGHREAVNNAEFSADGQLIVTASDDTTARVWDFHIGKSIVLAGHTDSINGAEFSADGERIVTASNDGTARVWDWRTDEFTVLEGHNDWVLSARFSADGEQVVTGSRDGTVRVWDWRTGESTVLEGYSGSVSSAQFSADGERVLTASFSNTVARVWNWRTGESTALEGHSGGVESAEFSADGQLIVTASDDNTARVWDLAGRELAILTGHRNWVNNAQFSTDGERVVTASSDGTVRVWAWRSDSSTIFEGGVGAELSANGERVVTASDDNTAQVWDLRTGESTVLEGHSGAVTRAKFSANGQRVVTFSLDTTFRVWDLRTRESIVLAGDGPTLKAEFSADGEQVVTVSDNTNTTAKVWDLSTGESIVLEGHREAINSAEFSAGGERVVTASNDGTVRVWDLRTRESTTLAGHSLPVNSAEFSAGGERVVTASNDGTIRVWDLRTGDFTVLAGHSGPIFRAQFSADNERVVSVSSGNTARVWDLRTGEFTVLTGHSDRVISAEFSADGERVVTGSFDQTARVWDLAGRELAVLTGHSNWILDAQFSADGKRVVTFSLDNTVRVWPVSDLSGLLQRACDWLAPSFVSYPDDLVHLTPCQTPDRLQLVARVLVRQGEQFAKAQNVEAAISTFIQAQELHPDLDINPTQRATNLASTVSLVDEGRELARTGDIEQAIGHYQDALVFDANAVDPADWNALCRFGSLYGYAQQVLSACESAVAGSPFSFAYRDSRGVTRALTGDIEGAIADFEFYIQEAGDQAFGLPRQPWIDDLRAGIPSNQIFTPAVLEQLKSE